MMMDRNFSTKDQAMATAFVACSVGDEVMEHFEGCEDGEECNCQPILWRLTDEGWLAERPVSLQ